MRRRAVVPGGRLAILCSAAVICRINGVVRARARSECDKLGTSAPRVRVRCQRGAGRARSGRSWAMSAHKVRPCGLTWCACCDESPHRPRWTNDVMGWDGDGCYTVHGHDAGMQCGLGCRALYEQL
jgi:hypothetical protein